MIDGLFISIQFLTKFFISDKVEYNKKNIKMGQIFFH